MPGSCDRGRREIVAPVPFGVCRLLPSVAHSFSARQRRSRTTKNAAANRWTRGRSPRAGWPAPSLRTPRSVNTRETAREDCGAFRTPNSSAGRNINGYPCCKMHRLRLDRVERRGDLRFQRTEYGRYTAYGSPFQLIVWTSARSGPASRPGRCPDEIFCGMTGPESPGIRRRR